MGRPKLLVSCSASCTPRAALVCRYRSACWGHLPAAQLYSGLDRSYGTEAARQLLSKMHAQRGLGVPVQVCLPGPLAYATTVCISYGAGMLQVAKLRHLSVYEAT